MTENRPAKRVLVVNDTQEILELFEAILGEMGLDSVLMSYAPRELERIRQVRPDLIILDFVFGERELMGWQLLQKIKMDRRLDSVPIVVCTAAVRAVEEQQGVVVVLKPFNVEQLEEAVSRALEMAPTARAIARRNRDAQA